MNIEQKFIELRLVIEDASLQEDHKRNNRAMKSLKRIFKTFEMDINSANLILGNLLKHKNACVRAGAATFCFSLNIHLKEAELTLKEVAKNPSNKMVAFNAKNTLEIWNSQGYLKMYPEQEVR